jgi:serine/threonine-protein kinase
LPAASSVAQGSRLVKVRINTEPDGAEVKEGGVQICTSTPCDVIYREDEAEKDHALLVSKPGFRTASRVVRAGDSPILIKLARARSLPKQPGAEAPSGFKEIPY